MKRYLSKTAIVLSRALSVLLAVILSASPFLSAVRAESWDGSIAVSYTVQYSSVLDYLYSTGVPVFGSIGGEWKVLALARSGRLSPNSNYAASYYSQIEQLVRANGSPMLDSNKSTENSRLIIALTSIGRDARNVAGYDLTAPFSDFNFVKRQGVNGSFYALIALDSHSSYGMNSIKNQCVNHILEMELQGGGWNLSGFGAADPDMTAMALTALARHLNYPNVRPAVNRAIDLLASIQNSNGSFSSYGSATSESCSQVITALSALGIDAGSDSRFVKNGKSVVDALLTFFVGNGFSHTLGGGVNGMASEQAAYSLCAYDRYKRGSNSLYNMNDVTLQSTDPIIPPITNAPTDTPTPSPTNTPTPSPRPTYTPTPRPSDTPFPRPTNTPTPRPSNTPTSVPQTPTPSPRPTQTPTPRPTNTPPGVVTPTPFYPIITAVPTQVPTGEPTDIPSAPPDVSDVPSATPYDTEVPTVEPAASEDPTEDPAVSASPEATDVPTPSPTLAPAETDNIDPSDTANVPDLTFDPISITGGDWNGNSGARREKLKWLVPAGIAGILAISGIFLFFASRRRDQ